MDKPQNDAFETYLAIDITAAELRRTTSILNTVMNSFFRDDFGRPTGDVFEKRIEKSEIDDIVMLVERANDLGRDLDELMEKWGEMAPAARTGGTSKLREATGKTACV